MGMVARSRAERRYGDWIAIAAHVERAPLRFAFTFAFGELPEGWDESSRRASTWAGIVGLLLLTPFIALAATGLLRSVGIGQPYEWLARAPACSLEATIRPFLCTPPAVNTDPVRILP